jgi:hypothetical protein
MGSRRHSGNTVICREPCKTSYIYTIREIKYLKDQEDMEEIGYLYDLGDL